MTIKEEIRNDVVIIRLEGKVMGGPDATTFHGKIHEHVESGIRKIVVDLGKVRWISSIGLGMLISAMTTLKKNEGQFRIANLPSEVQSLFLITRLIKVFDAKDSVDEAIESFE